MGGKEKEEGRKCAGVVGRGGTLEREEEGKVEGEPPPKTTSTGSALCPNSEYKSAHKIFNEKRRKT